ncbi:DUF4097 family beta strand repeat-containing protein [Streptomyces halobius]|uniref:DUF4097 domain-containing protein n=1 Tax=Streptomyces halobius TaxID=2879846 RepID=A0ABY4M781_9ACTN|nr:DUF4097 family beta strand repeat-containing protein [Streptomyces halobius]UQA93153.1 DUF4097 domain-containing protein [Streptomyces halobius]
MSAGSEWPQQPMKVDGPRKLEIEAPVDALNVRLYGGTVNVVGTSDGSPARLEISEVDGPPLTVSCRNGTLSIGYEDLPWRGFLKFLDRRGWNRGAVVSVTVPAATRVEVGVVGAAAVVSGISGRTELRGVSGDSTLVGLTGPVQADTVTGRVEAQAVTGDLRFHSVSGDLTVIDGAGGSVRADSVSGDMVLDLDPAAKGTDINLTTVSGEVAIRLPDPAEAGVDAKVDANTTSGTVSNAFDELRVSGQWGAKRISGALGAGTGTLKATTVSGGLALLRRPAFEQPQDTPGSGPGDGPGDGSGHGPGRAPGPGPDPDDGPGPDPSDGPGRAPGDSPYDPAGDGPSNVAPASGPRDADSTAPPAAPEKKVL